MVDSSIKDFVESTWDVGIVRKIERFSNGVTNLNFKVICLRDDLLTIYALKRYEVRVELGTVEYEHAFMNYIKRYSGSMTSVPIITFTGATYIQREEDGKKYFWALFTFLHGETKYTWLYNKMSNESIRSCGAALAKFHIWGMNFHPTEEMRQSQVNALDRFSQIKTELESWIPLLAVEGRHRNFIEYFQKYQELFFNEINRCRTLLEYYEDRLPTCSIHQDINQGNMMFDKNDKVCAILDLDWVVRGKRLYDVAWMAQQMLSSWDESNLGSISMEKLSLYLKAYNAVIGTSDSPLDTLTETEQVFLPEMMIITELTVIRDFVDLLVCDREKSDILYYFYLCKYRHIIFDTISHSDEIREIAKLTISI